MAAWVSGLGSNDPNRARRNRGRSMGRGRVVTPGEHNSKAVVLCLDKDLGQGNWVGGNGRSPNREEGNSVYRRLPTIDTKTNAPRATLLLLPHYPYGGKLVPKPSTAGKEIICTLHCYSGRAVRPREDTLVPRAAQPP